MAAESLQLQLFFRPPYCWPQVRDFLARRAVGGMETVGDGYYQRTFRLDHARGSFKAAFNQERRCFDVSVQLDEPGQLEAVVRQIRRLLDLDIDSSHIGQCLQQAGIPADLLIQGIRLPGVWDSFEAGCRAILGQQISVTAAVKLLGQLVRQLGYEEDRKFHFPEPEVVALSDLAFLGMPESRRQTLKCFARYWVEQSQPHALDAWLDIKGIGPWTVAYAKLRGQSQSDVWLDSDLMIKKQLEKYRVDAAKASPWRSYLTFQLWSMA